jgi:hypothetical protein
MLHLAELEITPNAVNSKSSTVAPTTTLLSVGGIPPSDYDSSHASTSAYDADHQRFEAARQRATDP